MQTFREVGLLMAPTRVFAGGGGSGGRYPPEAIQRAKDAIAIRKQYPSSLAMAVAVMFARDTYPMDGAKVQRALVRSIEQLLTSLRTTSGDPLNVEAGGAKLAKRAARDPSTASRRRNIRRSPDRRRIDTLAEIMTAVLDTLHAGIAPEPDRLALIAEYAGAPPQLAGTLAEAMAAPTITLDAEAMALDRVTAGLRTSSWEDIQQARDDARAFDEFIVIGPAVLALIIGAPDPSNWRTPPIDHDGMIAAHTAINVSRMQLDRSGYDEDMKWLRVMLATHCLATQMPPEVLAIAEADQTENQLTPEQVATRDDFRARFATEFPTENRILIEYNQGT